MQVFKRTNQALPPTDGNLTPLAARTPGRRYEGINPDPVTKEARECEYPDAWETQADAEQATFASGSLARAKVKKISALNDTLSAKLALGWTYGGKTYQVTEKHVRNMERFVNALNYYVDEIALWFTATAYVSGDLVRVGRIFYRCAENHTSGVWLTDLAAVKWTVWFFHPYKGGDGKWRASDNSMNALTLAQTKAMCEGAINYESQCQAQAIVHKDGVNACADITALNAYDITAGWPANS